MPVSLSLDRFEGDVAVLASEAGVSIDVPRAWLPPGVKPGDVLTVSFARDDAATRKLARDTKALQDELKAGDDGGDLAL